MRGLGLKRGPYIYKFLKDNSRTQLAVSIKHRIDKQKYYIKRKQLISGIKKD